MLGPFRVCDRNGKDITLSFTPRLKELLLLLILHSEKDTRGISVKRLTELLWFDKEDNQARNNRNVTVRKLRVLLETVGDVDIVNENGTMRIEWGEVWSRPRRRSAPVPRPTRICSSISLTAWRS